MFKLEFSSWNTHSCIKKTHKKTETRSISLYHIPSIWEIFFCDSFSVIFCSHSILETWAFFSASKKVQNFMYLVHHWKFKVNFVSLAKQWVFFLCVKVPVMIFYHIQYETVCLHNQITLHSQINFFFTPARWPSKFIPISLSRDTFNT